MFIPLQERISQCICIAIEIDSIAMQQKESLESLTGVGHGDLLYFYYEKAASVVSYKDFRDQIIQRKQ